MRPAALRLLLIASALSLPLTNAPNLFAQKDEPPLHKTTYYLHGRIYTNDPKQPWAAAMAIRDEKLLCVGTIAQIMLECGGAEAENVVQLNERFVMPGFNDAHVHVGGAARDKLSVVLNGATSVADIQKLVKDAAAKKKPGEWILGSGWDQTRWADKKFPTRLQLDEAAPNNPVFLVHVSGHVAVANSEALKHAEITPDTKNPMGGEIEQFEDGEPSGMLKENAAMQMVEQRIPDPSDDDRRKGIEL